MTETTPPQSPLDIERARVVVLERENQELRAKLVAMDKQLRRILRRFVFPVSETLIHDPGQQVISEIVKVTEHLLADAAVAGVEAEVAAVVKPANVTGTRRKPVQRARGLLTLPDHLAIVEERIILTPEQRVDSDGTPLVPIGEERTSRLDLVPSHFIRLDTIRIRYGRMDTREPVVTAPVPPAIVVRGLGADRLVLDIAYQKYSQGVPLYRQRVDWLRHGVNLSTQTTCSWMSHLSNRIAPLVGAIRQQILSEPVLHLDDTPIKRWQRGKRGSCHTSRIWCYTAGNQVYFDFTDNRQGHWPVDVLRGYTGEIVADAYSGHDALFIDRGGTAYEDGCWSHARRPFHELLNRSPVALEMLELIQGLFRIDEVADIIAEATSGDLVVERTRLRRCEAPILLEAIQERVNAIIGSEPEQSELAQGARYIQNQWIALNRFVQDGRIPLTNNAAERQMKTIAVGRKNWLFVASEDGGTWAADLFTVFQSCRLQGLDAIAYLTSIMPALIAGNVDPLKLTPAAHVAECRQTG